jgi:hypothetical protein
MLFVIITIVFAIGAVLLEKEKAISCFLITGIFFGIVFIQLGSLLIGLLQFLVFAGLSLFLTFYQRIKERKEISKNQPILGIVLLIFFLLLLSQIKISTTNIIFSTELWMLRPVDATLLGLFAFSVALMIKTLRRKYVY